MQYLQKLKDLDLQEVDVMVIDNAAWQIGRMVFALQITRRKMNGAGRLSGLKDRIAGTCLLQWC
jgi:hypothetical protein